MSRAVWGGPDPDALPALGSVLELAPDQWRYGNREHAVRVQVERVMPELSRWYSGKWVWVEGPASIAGGPEERRQILVRIDAIPADCRAGGDAPEPEDAP